MKNLSIFLLLFLILGCTKNETGVVIKRHMVSIIGKSAGFYNIVPVINQAELKLTGSDLKREDVIAHFIDHTEVRKIDLLFKTVTSDSLIQYQVFARLIDTKEWSPKDTLKLFFNTSDSIRAGIYSILYPSVFCWTKPVQFTDFKHINKNDGIQFAYWKNHQNCYVFAMPMGGKGFAFRLVGEKMGFGAVGVTGFKTNPEGDIPVLSLSVGNDFYKLVPASFKYSFDAMGISENLRVKKTKPDMYNYLGWATWNAFKHNLTEEKIIKSAKSFKAEQIPVKWFLIDDGWLDITDNKLNSYVPDRKKFPAEFKKMTSLLRNEYGIKEIGVWHTLNGYWQGLNDSGQLARSLKDKITYYDMIPWLSNKVNPFLFVNPLSYEGHTFYQNWYKYLKEQGITFVKVDNQLVVKKLADGNSSFWQTGEKAFGNLNLAVNNYFNGKIINCMNMTNIDFYHYSKSPVARTVEDYNPENDPKLFSCEFRGNAASHIIASVHNSVWLSNIVWPDYDMFQSSTKDAWYYAVAKIMSNGPVYLTDSPGKHNASLLKSITFSDGRIINADVPELPTEDCLFQMFESDKPFKVFSTFRNCGLLAAWNVSDRDSVTGSFSPSSVRGISGTEFIVFEFFSKSVTETGLNGSISLSIGRTGCKLYSVIPVVNGRAVIGNEEKIIPMAAVSNINQVEKSVDFVVSEPCTIRIYSKTKPSLVKINTVSTGDITYDRNILTVKVDKPYSRLDIGF